MLITDEVRKAFPSSTDDEIERFYKSASTEATGQSHETLLLAEIALVFGWGAMKEFLSLETGTDCLTSEDIADLLLAAREIRNGERLFDLSARFASGGEATSKKSAKQRQKAFDHLKEVLA